jgi:nucleotide-binding universal stress UspA family protein
MTNSIAVPSTAVRLARILAPIDFSAPCRHAAEDAATLARHFGAELVLLHAVVPVPIPFGPAEAFAYTGAADLSTERVVRMTPVLEEFLASELRGLRTRRVLVEADPARAILDYATERQCDLIVMPTHGHNALHRLVAGSVTLEVLKHAACPVWTGCHFEHAHLETFRTVLCAVDFGPRTQLSATWAAGFAREFGATLHMVHSLPETTVHSGMMYFDPEWQMQLAHKTHCRMAELQAEIGVAGETHVPLGDVAETLASSATSMDADVLMIGRGPQAYSIIRAAPCPVVVV